MILNDRNSAFFLQVKEQFPYCRGSDGAEKI